jgi:small-conductance mechanosensitive channel
VVLPTANYTSGEEQTTLIIGAIVFALVLMGVAALVIWKSAWKQGRGYRNAEEIDHAAIARHLLVLLSLLIAVVGPFLIAAVAAAGGILVGIATLFGASLLVGTLIAAALILVGSALAGLRNLEDFLGERADYISPRQVKAIDREMEERLEGTRER